MLALALFLLVDEPDVPLLPLGSVHRPAPVDDIAAVPQRCVGTSLPPVRDRLPFGPGELLSYDVTLLGIRTGKVHMKVSEKTSMDGVPVYPLQAQATSDAFLDVLGKFDGKMTSFFDPSQLLPIRMVDHVVSRQPFVDMPTDSREDAAFARGRLAAHLKRTGPPPDPNINMTQHLETSADVVDVVSVVYYLRSRDLSEGAPFCFELYHRRRLWHVEGNVAGVEVVHAPAGDRRARRLDAVVTRVGSGTFPPRNVTAWISDDADRFPMLVSTPDKIGTIDVKLTAFTRGRRLVAR